MTLLTPTLGTERLRLRPFTAADADDLFALQSNAHVLCYWDSPPWTVESLVARFMAECRQMTEDASGAGVAINARLTKLSSAGALSTVGIPTLEAPRWGTASTRRLGATDMPLRQRASWLQWAFDALELNGDVSDSWVYGLLRCDWTAPGGTSSRCRVVLG